MKRWTIFFVLAIAFSVVFAGQAFSGQATAYISGRSGTDSASCSTDGGNWSCSLGMQAPDYGFAGAGGSISGEYYDYIEAYNGQNITPPCAFGTGGSSCSVWVEVGGSGCENSYAGAAIITDW